jgi:phosphoserine aminotransferase
MSRVFNFSGGPAMLPEPVLVKARDELLSHKGSRKSVMEISHRSEQFLEVLESAETGLRSVMELPSNYRVLFIQGGATMQFSMVPLNLLRPGRHADYITTGAWGRKAIGEASRFGDVSEVYSSQTHGFTSVPTAGELSFSENAAYIHYTSNETIDGVEFHYDLDGGGIPIVCDASSNMLSKPMEIEKYSLIYAGAQKNIGPSGITVVIIRDDLLAEIPDGLPLLLDYRTFANADSMPNTPNTWGIYLISLVADWLKEQGGLSAMEKRNRRKAELLYKTIDSSDGFYTGHAERHARSRMNVTFRLPSPELDEGFCSQAEAAGLTGLAGHRSVGGVRASLYNAMPPAGVEALTEFMRHFAAKNA